MKPGIIDGGANTCLAAAVANLLDAQPIRATVARFPDGEANVQILDAVVGRDVYIVQPTTPPADAHIMELVLLADAAKRGGAAYLIAVVPYFGYARQDHDCGRPKGASLIASMIASAGVGRIITLDPHSRAVEMSAGIPVSSLSAARLLAERLRAHIPRESVVVAPDLGAVKLADDYARALDLPMAFVRKRRLSGSAVETYGVVGAVAGRVPIIVDDMISTGGTIVAAAEACMAAGGEDAIHVAASHALFAGDALERLERLPIRSLVTTDSVPAPTTLPPWATYVSIAPLLADEIARVHADASLATAP